MEPIIRGIYVIHIALTDLVDQAAATRAEGDDVQAFVAWYSSREYVGGVAADLSSVVDVGWVAPSTGIVHAGRILVERVSLLAGDTAAREEAVAARGAQARALVEAELQGRGITPRGGRLLVPGLRDDLQRTRTAHELWTWQIGDRYDPCTWTLIPV